MNCETRLSHVPKCRPQKQLQSTINMYRTLSPIAHNRQHLGDPEHMQNTVFLWLIVPETTHNAPRHAGVKMAALGQITNGQHHLCLKRNFRLGRPKTPFSKNYLMFIKEMFRQDRLQPWQPGKFCVFVITTGREE